MIYKASRLILSLSPCFLSLLFLAARFQKNGILVFSPLSLPFPFSPSVSFSLIKHKKGTRVIKQWKGKQGGDSLRVDLSVLHHILPSAYLFCSFPYPSPSHSSSFCFSYFERRDKGERDKGERINKEECHLLCVLFCLSLFSIHLSSILFFALPIKNVIVCIYPLSFSLPPLLLFPSKRQKRKKGRTRGEWRPCSFLLLFQWMRKVSRVGPLPVDPPHALANPSSRPIASVLFLVAKLKRSGFLYMFIVLPVVFFKGKSAREEKDKKERKNENERHLLLPYFCTSLFCLHFSAILFIALPIKIAFLLISPLSFLSPFSSLVLL